VTSTIRLACVVVLRGLRWWPAPQRHARLGAVLERIADRPKIFVLDFCDVPFLDSTAAHAIEAAIMKANRSGVCVLLTGTTHSVRQVLWANGVRPPKVRFKNSIEDALASAGR
jgi:sulfate permease, SulP family